jgi:AbrB family looped-hinge helix DNA binding protein
MTQKGQVTVPAAIRAHLGLKPRDRVRFEVDGAEVKIKPAPSRIARHFGAVRTAGAPLSAQEERWAFEEGVAEDTAGKDTAGKDTAGADR